MERRAAEVDKPRYGKERGDLGIEFSLPASSAESLTSGALCRRPHEPLRLSSKCTWNMDRTPETGKSTRRSGPARQTAWSLSATCLQVQTQEHPNSQLLGSNASPDPGQNRAPDRGQN